MEVVNSDEEDATAGNKGISGGSHIRYVIKPTLAIVIVVLCFAGIVFLVYSNSKISPAILENKQEDATVTSEDEQDDVLMAGGSSFADCKPLQENCTSGTDCISSSICGEGIYETCEIYDCGDTYGVYTQSGGGSVNIYKQAKADKNIAQPKQEVCKGLAVEALEQKCTDNKMQVKVKLTTEGECKIDDFIVLYDNSKENQPNTFVSLGKDMYSIEVKTCGRMTDIIPRTEGGVPIF